MLSFLTGCQHGDAYQILESMVLLPSPLSVLLFAFTRLPVLAFKRLHVFMRISLNGFHSLTIFLVW